jgi:hypothetical protein
MLVISPERQKTLGFNLALGLSWGLLSGVLFTFIMARLEDRAPAEVSAVAIPLFCLAGLLLGLYLWNRGRLKK